MRDGDLSDCAEVFAESLNALRLTRGLAPRRFSQPEGSISHLLATDPEGSVVEIEANLETIFDELRGAGYTGPIVVLEYYSLSYSDPTTLAGTEFLDSVIAGVTTANGGILADGFRAFEGPSAAFGGDPCAAGLLIKLPDGTCNIHPSPAGQRLLAGAIADAIGA